MHNKEYSLDLLLLQKCNLQQLLLYYLQVWLCRVLPCHWHHIGTKDLDKNPTPNCYTEASELQPANRITLCKPLLCVPPGGAETVMRLTTVLQSRLYTAAMTQPASSAEMKVGHYLSMHIYGLIALFYCAL